MKCHSKTGNLRGFSFQGFDFALRAVAGLIVARADALLMHPEL
jgi:hypothetical protein